MALASSQIALTAVSAYSQYKAAKDQGRYQRQVAEQNATLAETSASDAIRRGKREALDLKARAKTLIGSQRASLAAQGIEVNSGSAADIQADTAGQAAMDALTIKNNAWREAWGYKAQARTYRTQGALDDLAARNEARQTILTGGLSVVQSGIGGYDRFQRNQGTKYKWV